MTHILPILLFAVAVCGDRYDNSQHGKENYILDMEDVVVVAIHDPENYDTDYYDYSDLTVKPEEDLVPPSPPMSTSTQASVAPGPSTTSAAQSSNNSTAAPAAEAVAASTKRPLEANPQHPLNTHNMQIPVVVVTDPFKKKGYVSSSSIRKKNANVDVGTLPKRNCAPGFVLDEKNRCKKNRGSLLSRHRIPLPYGLHYAQRPHMEQANTQLGTSS